MEETNDQPMNFLQQNYQNQLKLKVLAIEQMNKINIDLGEVENNISLKDNKEQQLGIPLCCRSYFFYQQVIPYPENLRSQYKYFKELKIDEDLKNSIKETICGFLNAEGGIIYIGIKQLKDTKKKIVLGFRISEIKKQNFRNQVIKMAQNILPNIIGNSQMISLNFVPIKAKKSPYQFISGSYVIKINVKFGEKEQVYSYLNDLQKEQFAFKMENKIIHLKSGQEVLKILKDRILKPYIQPKPTHQGTCKIPQIGRPLYDQ